MSEQITADQLRQVVERIERLNEEIGDYTAQRKGVYDEAKANGFDAKAIRKIVALRKKRPDQIAEEEAVEEVYRAALGL